jgi:hypothetical protein
MMHLPASFAIRRQQHNAGRGGRGPQILHHLTVCEKFLTPLERFGGFCVFSRAGYPPAPTTGSMGRGCGDASRALLFFNHSNDLRDRNASRRNWPTSLWRSRVFEDESLKLSL